MNRQVKGESRASPLSIAGGSPAPVLAGHSGHDRQSEPGARARPGLVALPEAVESVGQRFSVEAPAVVAYAQHRFSPVENSPHFDGSARLGVTNCVGDQVGDGLAHMCFISRYHHRLRGVEGYGPPRVDRDRVAARVSGQNGQIDRRMLQLSMLIEASE
jgi:hypothetical protein